MTCTQCLGATWLPPEEPGGDAIRCGCRGGSTRVDVFAKHSMVGDRLRSEASRQLDAIPDQAVARQQLKELTNGERHAVLLVGPPGRGKSLLAARAAHILQFKGTPVLWVYWPVAVDKLRAFDAYDPTHAESPASWTARLRTADVLVIDDLGVERLTDFAQEQLDTLMEFRNQGTGRLIVTTNHVDDLGERIGERAASRLLRMCDRKPVLLGGPDQRLAA